MGLNHSRDRSPARILVMASFRISAAVPWIGVFNAHRSAKDFCPQLSEAMPGRYLRQIHDELTFIIPEDRLSEAVAFIRACMEEKPFPEFDLPLIAEASAGQTFGMMEELED